MHYVTSGGMYYPGCGDPAGLAVSDDLQHPDANRNPGGNYQSVWMDLYVPQGQPAGDYTGTLTVRQLNWLAR